MAQMFSKKGNAAGFTQKGHPICGAYQSKTKLWSVWVDTGLGPLTNSGRRLFDTERQAAIYAETLIDATKTEEMKWW